MIRYAHTVSSTASLLALSHLSMVSAMQKEQHSANAVDLPLPRILWGRGGAAVTEAVGTTGLIAAEVGEGGAELPTRKRCDSGGCFSSRRQQRANVIFSHLLGAEVEVELLSTFQD